MLKFQIVLSFLVHCFFGSIVTVFSTVTGDIPRKTPSFFYARAGDQIDFYFLIGFIRIMSSKKHFRTEEAKRIGEALGIDWSKFDVEQFRKGIDVELEHGLHDPNTNVTNDDPIITGKIALAHLNEFPDYYTRLEEMEEEAEKFHKK